MTIYDSFVCISAENLNKLENLYGKLQIDELTKVINKHLSDAIDEIECRKRLKDKNM